MSEEERKAKRAAHKVEVRGRQKAEREAAAAAAAAERKITLHQFNDVLEQAYLDGHPDSADDFHELTLNEWDAFCAWVAEQPEGDEFALDCCMEFYDAWRNEGSPDPTWRRQHCPHSIDLESPPRCLIRLRCLRRTTIQTIPGAAGTATTTGRVIKTGRSGVRGRSGRGEHNQATCSWLCSRGVDAPSRQSSGRSR